MSPSFTLPLNYRETIVRFDVPSSLQKLSYTLTVNYQKKELQHTGQYQLNNIDKTAQIEDFFLRRDSEGYHLYCAGKTGEPLV
jgi:hypothetical protein